MTYDWSENPALHDLSESDSKELSLILKDKRVFEFAYDYYNNSIIEYCTYHKIIKVNSDDAVKKYNKVFIRMKDVIELIDPKARVISGGKVQLFNTENIKELQGKDEYASLKYFAIEGAEVGSEIEVLYTLKKFGDYKGESEQFQTNEITKNIEFDIYTPEKIHFKTKSYNGFPTMKKDTSAEFKNHYAVKIDEVPALKSERYAAYNANLMKVHYKADYIEPDSLSKVVSYDDFAELIHLLLHQKVSRSTNKKVNDLLNVLNINDLETEKKIRKIENYIKVNYTIVNGLDKKLTDLEEIISSRICNSIGIGKLFVLLLEKANVQYKFGLTTDRFVHPFDPDFESYDFLENYFFYFPDVDLYLAPTEQFYRLGFIPFNWTHNYGLFVTSVMVRDLNTGIADIKFIPAVSYEKNYDNIEMKINIHPDFSGNHIYVKRMLNGLSGIFVQTIYNLLPEDQKEEIAKSLVKVVGEDVIVKDFKIRNSEADSTLVRPLIAEGNVSSNTLVEKAGNKYLLKIGEVIGLQQEMYQKYERRLDIENNFNRKFDRIIEFNIPSGYTVKNLDDLRVDVYHEVDGERDMAFTSTYERSGDKVKVTIYEYYKKIRYPVEMYDSFKEVINAAADFNKKVLIFEKN